MQKERFVDDTAEGFDIRYCSGVQHGAVFGTMYEFHMAADLYESGDYSSG